MLVVLGDVQRLLKKILKKKWAQAYRLRKDFLISTEPTLLKIRGATRFFCRF
jgi:hypothetical protein